MEQKNKTWGEIVREIYGQEITDEDVEFILWETTAYPFAPIEYVQNQLKENFEKYQKDINAAAAEKTNQTVEGNNEQV
jgi:apolipoprotein N-acyltransferase